MPTWLIIVLVVLLVLAVGGAIAARRRMAAREGQFERSLAQVNRDLAARPRRGQRLEARHARSAARRVYAAERGSEPAELELVQVIDRPGTDDDHAVFSIGHERLTLGRRDGEWVLEDLK
jgi:hypothetical protein